ncbi:MAG: hypothetical protein ACREP2_04830 [Rhodanobacteraceae bacterium]
MNAFLTPGAWRPRYAARRTHKFWQAVDGARDPLADVYTTEADARVMAASPRMLHVLQALVRAGQSTHAHAEAIAAANACDEVEHGPLGPDEQYIVMSFGPRGHWSDTPDGLRWQYPNGTLADDPIGKRTRKDSLTSQ